MLFRSDTYCTYDVTVDIYALKPCTPTFKEGTPDFNPAYYSNKQQFIAAGGRGGQDEVVRVFITPTSKKCEYEVKTYFKPIIYEPPDLACSVFENSYGVKTKYTASNPPPDGEIRITPRALGPDDTYCTYDVEVDLYVTDPCIPEFKEGTPEIGRAHV